MNEYIAQASDIYFNAFTNTLNQIESNNYTPIEVQEFSQQYLELVTYIASR